MSTKKKFKQANVGKPIVSRRLRCDFIGEHFKKCQKTALYEYYCQLTLSKNHAVKARLCEQHADLLNPYAGYFCLDNVKANGS